MGQHSRRSTRILSSSLLEVIDDGTTSRISYSAKHSLQKETVYLYLEFEDPAPSLCNSQGLKVSEDGRLVVRRVNIFGGDTELER